MTIINKELPVVIGIDHGYGNIKTASTCFPTGVMASDSKPDFDNDLLVYKGRYYTIGAGHKEFAADKIMDEDFYILTLSGVARELKSRNMTSAQVFLAAGLPLTWVGKQKERFKAYLLQNEIVDFSFRGSDYHVGFSGAEIFPQGFSAVAGQLRSFSGINMLCDIGNGTMNTIFIENSRPNMEKRFTEKYGTYQCILQAKEALSRELGKDVSETLIDIILRRGKADIAESVLDVIRETAKRYVGGIMRRLLEHGYDPELMRLYIMGGGSCLMKNFGECDPNRVTINEDICATAKGYEQLAVRALTLAKGGSVA